MIGSGKNRYQLLEVKDLIEAIWIVLNAEGEKVNDTFNIGALEFGTVYEDLMALCEYANSGAHPIGIPAWFAKPLLALLDTFHFSPLYRWIYGTADKDSFVSIAKIQGILNWKPKFSNAQALINSYQWYLDNKEAISAAVGVTHRVAWDQKFLSIIKRWL
jgi:nucleoside-diphosphate-sugar epimerase